MLKRYLDIAYLFILVLLLSIQIFGQHITGAGTVGDPYILYNARDLDSIRFIGIDNAKYYKLGNDIDFTGITGVGADTLYGGDEYWQPIVLARFDLAGDGYSIKGVKVDPVFNQTDQSQSCIFGAEIECSLHNIVFEQCSIITTPISGSGFMYIGILGKFESASVNLDTIIFRDNYIEANYGSKNSSYHYVGVIAAGYGNKNWSYLGSENNRIIADGSTNTSNYIGVGGLLGAYGTGIYGNGLNYCYTKNNYISATNNYSATVGVRVGGFVGKYIGSNNGIANSYSLNDTLVYQDKNDCKVGGMFGYIYAGTANDASTAYCYSRSIITGTTTNAEVGTFGGELSNDPDIDNWKSYTDTTLFPYVPIDSYISTTRDTTNTPHTSTTDLMKVQSTFVGFDFTNVWTIDPSINDGFPELIWALPTFAISTPSFGDTYNPGDSLYLTWLGEDTVKFYYSVDNGSSWIFKDTVDNYSYLWDWLSDHIAGNQVRCMITTLDSTLTASTLAFTCVPEFDLTIPNGGEVYFAGDTITITYGSSLDTTKFYYSTNSGSTWNYIAQDTASGLYNWIAPAINNTTMRILITSVDSAYQVESANSFSIFPSNKYLEILDPTETSQTVLGDLLKITVRSINADYFIASYSRNGSDFSLINDSVVVDPGDGIAPDTTIFYWNIAAQSLFGSYTIKVNVLNDSTFTGSSSDPYYGVGEYEYVGKRGAGYSAQSVNQWSDIYLLDDSLYTISFYGFVWGWYDYSDRIDLWKWNTVTDSFEVISTLATPGAAYYPYINLFRSSPYIFTMWNGQTGTSGYYRSVYKTAAITYPNTIDDWSSNVEGVVPINIDGGNSVVNYNGWQYTLDQAARTITATDLYNPGNDILVTDASAGGIVGVNNVDFYVFDDHIIISRRFYESEFGDAKVWIIGNAFPLNEPGASDEVSFVLQGVTRNYFRGVYKNAILEYFPPIR